MLHNKKAYVKVHPLPSVATAKASGSKEQGEAMLMHLQLLMGFKPNSSKPHLNIHFLSGFETAQSLVDDSCQG